MENQSRIIHGADDSSARLKERGIYDVAIKAGWKSRKKGDYWGWSYPVFDFKSEKPFTDPQTKKPGLRWKNFNQEEQGGPKYGWIPAKGECPPYYVLPGTRAAIQVAERLCYIAAGEVDVMTYHSAGMPNVISWLDGEGSVPADLVSVATDLGIAHFHYFVDHDKTGEDSAYAAAARLANSAITFTAYRFPDYLGEKGDINDLWKWSSFDAAAFAKELNRIIADPTYVILEQPAYTATVPKTSVPVTGARKRSSSPRTVATSHLDWDEIRTQWIIEEVMPQLEQVAPVVEQEGRIERRHCPSPHHPDHHPSFRISYDLDDETGVPLCSCNVQHEPFPWDKVADWVGARPLVDWWKQEKRPATATIAEDFETQEPNPFLDDDDILDSPGNILSPGLTEISTGVMKKPDDDEVGDALIAQLDGNWAYFYERWNTYTDGVWVPGEEMDKHIWDAMKEAKKQGFRTSKSKRASIEDYVKTRLRISNTLVDSHETLLNLRNGLFDLDTRTFGPHQRDLYFTAQLGFDYDPDATCPTWLRFLSEVLVTTNGETDHQLIALVQEAIGYSLTTDTRHEASFWLKGEPGSGKSTVLKVIQALLGSAFASLDLNTLEGNAYQLADLVGKRVVCCSEVKQRAKISDHILKPLISGEAMIVRQIQCKPFMLRPIAKIWWAMNNLPINEDRSNAIYRRVRIIPFHYSVAPDRKDIDLIDKLLAELPGIFNWALEGLYRLGEQGKFTEVVQVVTAVAEYAAEHDVEAAFLDDVEWCLRGDELITSSSDLYAAYNVWRERYNQPVLEGTKVGREWTRLGLTRFKKGTIFYKGIGLTPEAQSVVLLAKPEITKQTRTS